MTGRQLLLFGSHLVASFVFVNRKRTRPEQAVHAIRAEASSLPNIQRNGELDQSVARWVGLED